MAVYAISALVLNDTNLFIRARNSHASVYPNNQHLIDVDPKSCFKTCKKCNGTGRLETTCVTCQGKNICSACKGSGRRLTHVLKGTRSTGVTCNVCVGTGHCPDCNGNPVFTQCDLCKGRSVLFEFDNSAYANYRAVLKGLLGVIQNEENFVERLQKAKAETVPENRIRAFKSIIADYPVTRQEVEEIARLLQVEQAHLQNLVNERRELEQKQKREREALCSLRFSENVNAAVATLRDYLVNNPDSPDKIEIQSVLNECLERVEKKRLQKKALGWAGGLVFVLLVLSCININYVKYTLLPSYSTPRGTKSKVNADQFIDPLSLTSRESKSNVKMKTAQKPHPDE